MTPYPPSSAQRLCSPATCCEESSSPPQVNFLQKISKSSPECLTRRRKFQMRGIVCGRINPLLRHSKIARFGGHNVFHKSLRVAIVERKPGTLHLHHDLVPLEKH